MTLQLKLEKRDVVDAVRVQIGKRMWFFLLIMLLVFGWVVADMFSSFRAGSTWADILRRDASGLLIPVAAVGLIYWLSPMLAARKMILRPVTWELNDQRVRMTSEIASAELQWAAFVKFVESKRTMLLYVQKGQAHVIPKRELSTEQQTELRELIRAHVPQK